MFLDSLTLTRAKKCACMYVMGGGISTEREFVTDKYGDFSIFQFLKFELLIVE